MSNTYCLLCVCSNTAWSLLNKSTRQRWENARHFTCKFPLSLIFACSTVSSALPKCLGFMNFSLQPQASVISVVLHIRISVIVRVHHGIGCSAFRTIAQPYGSGHTLRNFKERKAIWKVLVPQVMADTELRTLRHHSCRGFKESTSAVIELITRKSREIQRKAKYPLLAGSGWPLSLLFFPVQPRLAWNPNPVPFCQ